MRPGWLAWGLLLLAAACGGDDDDTSAGDGDADADSDGDGDADPGNGDPIVTVGAPQTIQAPAGEVTLTGSATDPDGDEVTLEWTRTAGGAATIATPDAGTTQVTGLEAGFYAFTLTADDGHGGTGSAVAQVLVSPAPGESAGPGTNAGSGYDGSADEYADEEDMRYRAGLSSFETTALVAVPTFEAMGLYWARVTTVPEGDRVAVRYRVAGDQTWHDAMDLWFDARNDEYRGSIVGLASGTAYELEATSGSGTVALAVQSTWADEVPIARTVTVTDGADTLVVDQSGTADGWVLYTAEGGATIDMGFEPSGEGSCIDVSASYVVIRGLTLRNCQGDGIALEEGAHDVVIEGNDLSGFGHGPGGAIEGETATIVPGDTESGGITCNGYGMTPADKPHRIVVQGNVFHDPRYGSIHWGYDHPNSANAVSMSHCGGNSVYRYNEVRSGMGHYFMDGIGGSDNFTYEGFPAADSDIYGNVIGDCYDDGIEAEGGNRNVRIWGNYIHHTMVRIALATTSIGPVYAFRNVANEGGGMYDPFTAPDDEDRGPFFKLGTREGDFINGGRILVLHNTTIQAAAPAGAGAEYGFGTDAGLANAGGDTTNVYSRNNVWTNFKDWHSAIVIDDDNDCDHDLYSGNIDIGSGVSEPNGIEGIPTFAADVDPHLEVRTFDSEGGDYEALVTYVATVDPSAAGDFTLSAGSPGYGAALPLPNFNDAWDEPDIGAHQHGTAAMAFGPAALGF